MEVKCPNCRRVYLRTTDAYNDNILPNGSMVELLDKYKKLKWTTFGNGLRGYVSVGYSSMTCPSCTAFLLKKNRLMVVEADERFVCVCGKVCKSLAGLMAHKRICQYEK